MGEALTARGHTVRAYTFSRQYPERLFPGKTQLEEGPPPAEPAPRLLDTLGPWTWGRAARRIAADGAEVAVFKYWMPFFAPAFGTLARRLRRRGVTVLAVVDNALPHERRPGDRLLGRYVLGACDGLVVMSDQVRGDVEALVPGVPLRQIPHPVYDVFGEAMPKAQARAALGLPPAAPVLLFFGFIRRYKGLHVLLDAMPRVLETLPDARLVVAGEFYADEGALQAQAAPLGDAVRFDADYIPDTLVARYFGAADVVVQPYVSATQSGVAQIAFHFGRPVITTDVGGLAEAVRHDEAGLVVPPEDPAALAGAIVRFFREGMEARLSAGVERARAAFTWERLCEALEALWTAAYERKEP
jgi:glycosyltransferase involved in cell wall biosynthesis